MRFYRFIWVILLVSAFQLSWAQSQPDNQPIPERTLPKSVQLYPNPTLPSTEYLHVKVEEFSAEKVALTLHNIIGNKMEVETEVVSEHELRVRVKDLASGYYLLAVKNEEANFRGIYKFLKR